MKWPKPKFIDSPYYVSAPGGGWGYLKPGAPAEIQKEFKEYTEYDEHEGIEEVKKLTEDDII
ncbi:hypothetical protein WAK64_12790 [Bacillus spongiae]|uniref:Uncharacterized protein n=1 Tax=Bacillus spongiae TaxID=2683610 RepID=A0ABU8HFK4_9BACI